MLCRTVAFVEAREAPGKTRSASSNTMSSGDCPYTAVLYVSSHTEHSAASDSGLALSQSVPKQQGIRTAAVQHCVTDGQTPMSLNCAHPEADNYKKLRTGLSTPPVSIRSQYFPMLVKTPCHLQLEIKRHSRHSSVDAVTTLAE